MTHMNNETNDSHEQRSRDQMTHMNEDKETKRLTGKQDKDTKRLN